MYDSSHSRLYCTDILHNKIDLTALSRRGLCQIPGTFQHVRLQPVFHKQQKIFRDFQGVNRNSDVYMLTMCSTISFLE